MKLRIRIAWAALVLLCLAVSLAPEPALGLAAQKPFTHYADQEDLASVLADFARGQSLGVTFTPAVTGKVSGRFDNVPSREFLDAMRSAFGVCWYEQGGAIHFYHESENQRVILSPRIISARSLYEMLRSSSVLSPQLPIEVLAGNNLLEIAGPPSYLDQIRNAVAAFEDAQRGNFVMRVFPLKYAWAEDITVNSMDASVTIPGIATILRAMVSGSPVTASRVAPKPAAQQRLAGQGLISQSPAASAQQAQPVQTASQSVEESDTGGQTVNIIADPRVNSVLVTDAEYRMAYYEKVIADLDRPVELVEIHAAIVDIDSNYQQDLGVNFQGSGGRGDWSGGGDISSEAGKFNPLPLPGVSEGAGLTLSTLYTHGANFFLARIQAMEETGAARMLGRPSVLTMDNVQATLENTTTYYIPVQGKDVADLFKVEAGTVLKVTPHIITQGNPPPGAARRDSIKLVVSVQDDQNDGSTAVQGDSVLPPIKQTKINTQAIVGEGQSLLIGGYYYERQGDTKKGVPGLMSIPVLGGLFRTNEKVNKRMERLILITPRVVRLNDLPSVPERVDDPRFHQTPTQNDYEERQPLAQPVGGCSRKRPAPATPAQSAPVIATPIMSSPPVASPNMSSPSQTSPRASSQSTQRPPQPFTPAPTQSGSNSARIPAPGPAQGGNGYTVTPASHGVL